MLKSSLPQNSQKIKSRQDALQTTDIESFEEVLDLGGCATIFVPVPLARDYLG
jgi:hypothetical protein